MRIFRTMSDISATLADAYVRWYRQRYVPEHGDLVTNTTTFWAGSFGEPYLRPYSFPGSFVVPPRTPMICVGTREHRIDGVEYIFRFNERDVVLHERHIVYIRVASRQSSAQG